MPAKVNIGALLRKNLGKEAGDAMATKIEEMISAKKSAAQIERAIRAGLTAHIVKQKEWSDAICAKLSSPAATVSHTQKEWIDAFCAKLSSPAATVSGK